MIDMVPACESLIDVLAGVTDDRLDDATPCTDYTVGDLIDHLDQVVRGATALALGRPEEAGAAEPSRANLGPGWQAEMAADLRALGAAWQDPAAWQGSHDPGGLELPNEVWAKIALTEVVVHGWDIAVATGRPLDVPEPTLRACFDHVAEFVPKAPLPELWGPAMDVPDDAPLIDRIVAITGRKP